MNRTISKSDFPTKFRELNEENQMYIITIIQDFIGIQNRERVGGEVCGGNQEWSDGTEP